MSRTARPTISLSDDTSETEVISKPPRKSKSSSKKVTVDAGKYRVEIKESSANPHSCYTDEDISLLIRLKIEDHGGYKANHCYLLASDHDDKCFLNNDDKNKYFVLVTPAG